MALHVGINGVAYPTGAQLALARSVGVTTLQLASGQGDLFVPNPSPSAPIWVTACVDPVNYPDQVLAVFQVTGVTGDQLTGVTVATGYTDVDLPAGCWIECRILAEHFAERDTILGSANSTLANHVVNTSNPHSVTAAQVGAYTSSATDILLAAKAVDTAVVHLAGTESIAGLKTFADALVSSVSTTTPIVQGSSSSAGDVLVQGTSHATKGKVHLNGTKVFVDAAERLNVTAPFPGTEKPLKLGNSGVDGTGRSVLDMHISGWPDAWRHSLMASVSAGRLDNWITLDLCVDMVFTQERVQTWHPDRIQCHKPLTGATSTTPVSLGAIAEHADDAAAATGGVPVGALYRTGSVLKIRVS